MRPPMRVRASSTMLRTATGASSRAAASPAAPAPMIKTSASFDTRFALDSGVEAFYMSRCLRASLRALALVLVIPALAAWDPAGHRTVAEIAWEYMTLRARERAVALL